MEDERQYIITATYAFLWENSFFLFMWENMWWEMKEYMKI